MKKTTFCKNCGYELSKKERKCPSCGKSRLLIIQKILLAILIPILLFFLLVAVIAISTLDEPIETEKEKIINKNIITETVEQEEIIIYNNYSADTLLKDLNNNAYRAVIDHKEEYVKVCGYVGYIDDNGTYFTLKEDPNTYYGLLSAKIKVYINNSPDIKQKLLEKTEKDYIEVKGKITKVDSFYGYAIAGTEIVN